MGSNPTFSAICIIYYISDIYYVYILYSEKYDRYYIGHTSNLEKRLEKHNSGSVKSTKPYRPWKIVYMKYYRTKSEAVSEELRIKKQKSRKYIEWLIGSNPG